MGKGRRGVAALGAGVLAAGALAACSSDRGITINLYYAPEDTFQSVVDNCNAQAAGRYHIVYNKLQRGADDQRQGMVRRLAAGDKGLDILGLDVTWVPEFAEAGWAEEWTGSNKAAASAGVLPGPLETATWNGKLYAATKNTNVQLLWYDDRITPQPPATWDQLMAEAHDLKAQGKPGNVLFTGAQYEGLVVVYNTLVESAGGHILSDDGKSVVMDAGAVKALEILKQVTSTGITDPSLTNQKEDDVRQAFQRGNGAFELNWPFVYASFAKEDPQNLAHFKWSTYPAVNPGQPAKTTIGGYDLAVSSYSQHKPEAFEAALCLRNKDNQKFSALKDGVPPSIESLYTDNAPLDPSKPVDAKNNPSMQTAYPMRDAILAALKNAAVRPLTPAYQSLSTVISKVLSPPSKIDPQKTADELRSQLSDALQSKGVIP
ncbi:multiple sugar transport system substrate-binding protein [Amycolatopsis bartoniae]|uniref:Sugar ABC transporter substrate-binding protein n=1 Tax=Amycolatopsis bartoniae TaxID=941986 RepID=A0A8H9J4X7_9PSEU|nr:ABC transporter substrate-binding protein [Amycolatopsis bartoniae]MBB2937256.1 multiple sugar transport system substrate-binding protein [Amycolatopsis bartoniae]TVT07899.1 ABC transporter substrate-binding protein [Amycolatopsis bartoniae]GHF77677.1 sugar ABC transporter substrate-binding protein [Amycolatopsis bartoniae]